MPQKSKLATLLELEGISEHDFITDFALDSIVPGICMNKICDDIYYYEPDQDQGYCESCKSTSVTSGLILLGIM